MDYGTEACFSLRVIPCVSGCSGHAHVCGWVQGAVWLGRSRYLCECGKVV